ncbi:MAG TPA: cytochrome d ubiquinol oxidase subunit II [Mycobacteriales bacterium]|nr:cytochrome d ubiquinol oxidase subunit II [Mycobacteriales bacterium]
MLETIVLLFVLAGLVLYTVLAGADFGAGLWQLLSGPGSRGREIRDHAHHSMAAVWEANHVWLIFVLTVAWTAFPEVIGSLASTLTIPLSVAGLGIIFRGLAYALQSATDVPHERRIIDTTFAVSSVLTPYMLGAAVGAIASLRVPVGNAAGDLVTSWVNPTSILTGCLAVAVGAFLAAVYLAADATRLGEPDLVRAFRARALATGVLTGVLALGGLAVVHHDARHLYHGLTSGYGLAAVIVSGLGGLGTLALVFWSKFQPARLSAAVAVAAIIAGWAAAQRPTVLPGLTLHQAAAGRSTLIAVIVAVLAGGAILAPSLGLLFRLLLAGRFDPAASPRPHTPTAPAGSARPARAARLAAASLLIGFVLLTVLENAIAHAFGVAALLAAAGLTFVAVTPTEVHEG